MPTVVVPIPVSIPEVDWTVIPPAGDVNCSSIEFGGSIRTLGAIVYPSPTPVTVIAFTVPLDIVAVAVAVVPTPTPISGGAEIETDGTEVYPEPPVTEIDVTVVAVLLIVTVVDGITGFAAPATIIPLNWGDGSALVLS